LLEDAITATGVNKGDNKFLKVGINTDATNWYAEDSKMYDWDGPKGQLSSD